MPACSASCRRPGSPAADAETGLPGVRVSLPPGPEPDAPTRSASARSATTAGWTGRRRWCASPGAGAGAGHRLPVAAPGSGIRAAPAGAAAERRRPRRRRPGRRAGPGARRPSRKSSRTCSAPAMSAAWSATGSARAAARCGSRASRSSPHDGIAAGRHRIPGGARPRLAVALGGRRQVLRQPRHGAAVAWAEGAAEGRRGAQLGLQLRSDVHRRQHGRPGRRRRTVRGRKPGGAGSVPHRAASAQRTPRRRARGGAAGTAGGQTGASRARRRLASSARPARVDASSGRLATRLSADARFTAA